MTHQVGAPGRSELRREEPPQLTGTDDTVLHGIPVLRIAGPGHAVSKFEQGVTQALRATTGECDGRGGAHVAVGVQHKVAVPVLRNEEPIQCAGTNLALDLSGTRRRRIRDGRIVGLLTIGIWR